MESVYKNKQNRKLEVRKEVSSLEGLARKRSYITEGIGGGEGGGGSSFEK